jgi:hypothetical protein
MWLATIDTNRVAEHARAKLELYQNECAKVLHDHFFGRRQPPGLVAGSAEAHRFAIGALERLRGHTISDAYIDRFIAESVAAIGGYETAVETRLLDATSYLMERGIARKAADEMAPKLGRAVAKRYRETHGAEPRKRPRVVPGGLDRDVNAYTEQDRPLFDAAFSQLFPKALRK